MANTLLNVPGRSNVVQAQRNPQANVNLLNKAQQPVTSNANTTQGIQPTITQQQTTEQAVNPITIPIQIQPQIATTAQPTTTAQTNNMQALSVQPTQQTTTNNAPSPQQYQGTNNTNTVDFNQIYNQYQSAFGTNPSTASQGSSGIKKTSLNTTIVTPTTTNLNSVQGMYQSAYADSINSLISQMITELNQGFQYDPNEDEALKVATEYAANSTLQSLAGSGVLNSTATSERVARIVSELIPTYEEKAHDRYLDYLNQLANTAQIVMDYDSQQFQVWKDAKDREFQEKEFEYQKQQDAIDNAWKRVDELGYVDNEASAILGVAVGTLSGEARLAKEQREFELQKMREQAQIEYQNNKALAELKSQLDLEANKELAQYELQQNKELAQFQHQLDLEENRQNFEQNKNFAEYEYQLQQKYNTSSSSSRSNSSTTSLSTYQDIINNRWADYDEFSRRYTVTDNASLYNYLVSEYSAGRMSASDLANLTAMYNVTQPTSSDIAKQERLNYLASLEQYR